MSTAEILSLVSLISFIAAGVCLVLAVFLWFFFKIPVIVGDLSGRTARKSIAKMRQTNEKSGHKAYRSSTTNVARGKITDTMPSSEKLKDAMPKAKQVSAVDARPKTGILQENKAQSIIGEETAPLDGEETTTLLTEENETVMQGKAPSAKPTGGKKLTMINEVTLIHTDEVI